MQFPVTRNGCEQLLLYSAWNTKNKDSHEIAAAAAAAAAAAVPLLAGGRIHICI